MILGTCAALAAATATAPSASAEAVACTITGTSPAAVALGVTPERVQFGVQTDCAPDVSVNWDMASDIYPGSTGASWLLLRNYDYPTGEKFTFVEDPDGYFTVDVIGEGPFRGNSMAGPRPLVVGAYHDADADGLRDDDEPYSLHRGSFVLKRATSFGDGLTVSRIFRSRSGGGQWVRFVGDLQRADWTLGQYTDFAAQVELQFRPSGARHFRTVTSVWDDDGRAITTTARVTRTGSWRYRYAGDDVTGAVTSAAVRIAVHHR